MRSTRAMSGACLGERGVEVRVVGDVGGLVWATMEKIVVLSSGTKTLESELYVRRS